MGYHHGTAREVLETLLQGSYGVHVHVVGRLVEQQHVALILEGEGQVKTVPLTAGEYATELLLVRSGEIETGYVAAGVDFAVAQLHELRILGDGLIDALVRVYAAVLLVHIGQLDGLAYTYGSAVRLFEAHYKSEKGGLSGSVRAYDPDYSGLRKYETQVLVKKLVPV